MTETNRGRLLTDAGVFIEVPTVTAHPITYATEGLSDGTGAVLFTPEDGLLLLNAWVEILTLWDGTTPMGDLGTTGAGAGATGLWGGDAPLDMTLGDDESVVPGVLTGSFQSLVGSSANTGIRLAPSRFTSADPLCFWVTQDGTLGGADPESSQGEAVVYVVTATPN